MRPAEHAVRGVALSLSGVTFLFGLIGPLTPSEGWPSGVDLAFFVGMPLAPAFWAALSARHRGWRLAGLGLALFIVAVTAWLFGEIYAARQHALELHGRP